MDTNLDVDDALRTEFIDESLEMLSGLESLFISLEQEPDNLDVVQAIFRPIHSIKGNSSFFDFPSVKTLSHEMETILDLVRKKNLGVSPELIGAELAGVDLLKEMLERGRAGSPEVRDQEIFETLVARVKHVADQEMGVIELGQMVVERLTALKETQQTDVKAVIAEIDTFIAELSQYTQPVTATASEVVNPSLPPACQRIREILAAPIEEALEDGLAREVGTCLKSLFDLPLDDDSRAKLQDIVDNYDTFMDSLGFDELIQSIILDGLDSIEFPGAASQSSPEPAPVAPSEDAVPAPGPTPEPTPHREEAAKTMRVSETHVDTFLSYVGELLVVRDMYNHMENRIPDSADQPNLRMDFRRINETFAALSDDLQKSIMSIRLVAVGTILQRVPRLVRDVATMSKKEIAVVIEGETVEVDKSLIDLLEAPLTHMVRNAADHGIEAPDVRSAAGKEPVGNILVAVTEHANHLTLTIRDDGGGLDMGRIQNKAVELGIVNEGQPLSEEDIVSFLFQSGVSTADEITDVSGRGVGMDVVKRMVEDAGGSIHVDSKSGEGTTFEVSVPKSVTTQIVSGFLVETGSQRFVFPMTKVMETTRLNYEKVLTVIDTGKCFKHHDRIIPLVSMDSLLGLETTKNGHEDFQLVVMLSARQGVFGVSVDHVVGVQQVVVRPITGLICGTESIAGGALMGDGSVALIIDIDRMHEEYTAVTS